MGAEEKSQPRWRLAIDVGGTFTDLALHDASTGKLAVAKVLSTPNDPSIGALTGIDLILGRSGLALREVDHLVHATTHGANIVIEQAGARTALLVTSGFGDILLIQRQVRHSPYDLLLERHAPLVPRELVFEVPERIRFDGSIDRGLDEARVLAIAEELLRREIEAVAVCFLHSYANPAHERRVGELLRATLPEASVSLSSDVAPVMREYERASTTVVNAYIQPAFEQYLGNLETELAQRGFLGTLFVMQANGGITGIDATRRAPVLALESGPSGAVTMAAAFAREHALGDVLAFDMGGTTAKAGLVRGGRPGTVDLFELDKSLLRSGTGLPVMIPSVDIIEIGAGGGSIARVALGTIIVGPQSAGAEPGPACYARGGDRATVTDANLVLGYFDPDYFNGGALALDVEAARTVLERDIARPLGLTLEEAAWGVHDAVTANMEHAIRAVSIDCGVDPRTLTLVACGGAGPLHALRVARSLSMPRVLVPAHAGVFSSVGLLYADARFDLAISHVALLEDGIDETLEELFASLEADAAARIAETALGGKQMLERQLDIRYRGQGHTVNVMLPRAVVGHARIAAARDAFTARYTALYGHAPDVADAEVTAVRVVASVRSPRLDFPSAAGSSTAVDVGRRPAYFPELGGAVDVPVHRRAMLAAGAVLTGPAIVEDAESTLVVLPGDHVVVDAHRHLLVEICQTAEKELAA